MNSTYENAALEKKNKVNIFPQENKETDMKKISKFKSTEHMKI